MYTDADLNAAADAGILAHGDIDSFRDFIARHRAAPLVDEEHFRLLSSFNDIFISIAVILTLTALGTLGWRLNPLAGSMPVAVVSWGLGEYFTRKRRMALPSILLLIGFTVGAMMSTAAIMDIIAKFDLIAMHVQFGIAAAISGGAVYGHWRRFMVPITPALSVAIIIAILGFTVAIKIPEARNYGPAITFAGGIAAFLLAMRWDMADRVRKTRKSDVAFWLHLLAAPLLVQPVFAWLGLAPNWFISISDTAVQPGIAQAVAAVGIYAILALVALAIDRRAMLVSALIYVISAIIMLFRAAGSLGTDIALTALIIGSCLLLLSALWQPARRLVLAPLPLSVKSRLPPTAS